MLNRILILKIYLLIMFRFVMKDAMKLQDVEQAMKLNCKKRMMFCFSPK